MHEFKYKEYPTIFHFLSSVFAKEKISCVLIGGFAINYYKVSRQTADVDFLITKEDFEKTLGLLQEEGYVQDYAQEVFTRLTNNRLYLMDLDFMFIDKDTLGKILKDSKKISIAGQKFTVPSLKHLIALKLHSVKYNPAIRKNKDLPDIINLIQVNKVNIKSKEFRELCLKYGTKEIYENIMASI